MEESVAKFVIQPHGRLQEAVADENGYFSEEGLDYAIEGGEYFGVGTAPETTRNARGELISGAYESYVHGGGNKGRRSDISCACHWAVNQASANSIGRMWGGAYIVSPAAIMAHPDSRIRRPEDLAGKEIAVGYHSGSHFATIQALEPFLQPDDVKLKFVGRPWERVDAGVSNEVAATSVWGITYQASEQLGLRRIVDCTFMMAFMFPSDTNQDDVRKYMNAMKRAQMKIDLRPEKHKHLYAPLIPERYRDELDVRLFSAGERIVFLPYTEDTFARTQEWIQERGMFDEAPDGDFDVAVAR